ncbi:MAG: PDZ domain-containing protein, partial [Bacteroidia bacterium]|nr:PDZ domain-containing protein [Bacteroidia bacterium]
TRQERQVTFHKKFDVKSLDAGSNTIVYEQGGYLHVLDPGSGSAKQLEIHVNGDMNFARERWENIPANRLANANISPNGKRAIFEHRGEIFTVPKEKGSWRNLTNTPGVADRYPIWSPEGDQIAWFTDQSGEYEMIIADQMGEIQKTISIPNKKFYFTPDWSPNGEHLAFTDTDYNIWIVNIASGAAELVATDRYAHPNRAMNPKWSPCGEWIAYEKQLDSHFKAIFVYHVDTKATHQLTDGMADAITPVWDEEGAYIYFLGSTNYGLNTGWLDMSSYDPDITRSLYAIVLAKDGKAPNLPQSDEEEVKEEDDEEKEENGEGDKEKEDKKTVIDIDGIANRIIGLGLNNGNYIGLEPGPKGSIFVGEANDNGNGVKMHKFDIEKAEAEDFAEGVSFATVSPNRKHILIRKGNSWQISGTGSLSKNGKLDMGLRIKIDPVAEYHQIFKEGWRHMRDFLYVNNVHGAPWDDVYAWYAPWIDHVRHRTDLNYVVDIMSGEVAIGHSYVSGGDMPDLDRVPIGLLGCDFEQVGEHYKISKIYSGESWNPTLQAPLALPGIDVKEGDYLLAVNGQKLQAPASPYQLLEQTSGRETTISVHNTTSLEGAREVLVKPVSNERGLRTYDWVEGNRRKVDELSGGKLAYVYVPNTGGGGFTYFNRYYFAQQDKKGVIIDERNNGGGSAADYMIDIMAREVVGYFNSNAGDKRPWTTPMAGIWGPKVMLINERAGSGGDLLPYMFHAKQLGPLVGTRTWGGLVGTWDTPPFIDGGRMVAPRGGFFDVDGNWAVEGEGIAPDIEVIQDPKLVLQGRDPQLERGVEEAMRMLQTQEFQMKP